MSSGDRGFNPLAYHNGTVWPHDNSLVAWGLARYERWPEAHRIVRRMLEAAGHFSHQFPEVFAGFRRTETPFPIPYPTATKPQAWAAGTMPLLLQTMLGLAPDAPRRALRVVRPRLPHWLDHVEVRGLRVGEGEADLLFERRRGETRLTEITARDVTVVRTNRWPDSRTW